jgi:hypothetical protein
MEDPCQGSEDKKKNKKNFELKGIKTRVFFPLMLDVSRYVVMISKGMRDIATP